MSFLNNLKTRLNKMQEEAITAMGDILVSTEIEKTRIEVCNSCEHLFNLTRNCKKCGCFVDAKAKIKGQHCPINKW